jgi:hypothetical protein
MVRGAALIQGEGTRTWFQQADAMQLRYPWYVVQLQSARQDHEPLHAATQALSALSTSALHDV